MWQCWIEFRCPVLHTPTKASKELIEAEIVYQNSNEIHKQCNHLTTMFIVVGMELSLCDYWW